MGVMANITFTAEDTRNPLDSSITLVHTEDGSDCYGEMCGHYYEDDGRALKPPMHDHVVITGHKPATTSRFVFIPRE